MAMAPSGPRPVLLLTLALLVASLTLSSGMPWNLLNDIFNQHHVDHPKTLPSNLNTYCNNMMWKRGIYWKLVNTFIHKPIPSINSICSGGGTDIQGGLRRSTAVFLTTKCTFNPLIFSYTGTQISRQIVITCWKGLPVNYRE
ncbi:ribonuclease-like [Emys orbicularis]|uniref:ribonuclease-like n=1 Tax=Emys orbicularis TaxID=82168 RepID=UPI0031FCCB30